jgi:glucose/arabinose dehydrogenase
VLLALLVAGACTSDGPKPASTGSTLTTGVIQPTGSTATGSTGPSGSLRDTEWALERVATLEQPIALAVRSGDAALYFAEKSGRVVALRGERDPEVVLDLSGEISFGGEQGLLGITFSPDGDLLYADYTDTEGNTRVVEFKVLADRRIDPTARELLFVEQPFSNHNGGAIAFGPDGYLYIALGDGGAAGDPNGNAQSLSTLLGKLLRISPEPSGASAYTIPADNPFVGRDGARPEIWAYGLRNPWRFSFDRRTGDLWIGDVGQSTFEEIDVELAGSSGGSNFGWDSFEGTARFEGDAVVEETVLPVYQYSHDGSVCAVTGGYVYRGEAIPDLQGAYVFGDFCGGRLEAIRLRDGGATEPVRLGPTVPNLASFGEDADGELYVLSLPGDVYRLVPVGG